MSDAYEARRTFIQDRGAGYDSARRGQRFSATHQTPTTNVTGQTSFVATTPTFLICGSTTGKRLSLAFANASQTGTVAGGQISIAVAIDTANRYSSGGTAVTPQNMSSGSSLSSVYSFFFNPTATSAGAGTRYIWTGTVDADLGTVTMLDFEDGAQIESTGSILVYTWAASTGPSWKFQFEWAEGT